MHKAIFFFIFSALTFNNLLVSENLGNDTHAAFMIEDPKLILNMHDEAILPKKFRMALIPTHLKNEDAINPTGFEALRCSGSGQFSRKSLETMLLHIPSDNIIIVDLRQESHGFLNGHAVSWYGNFHNWANTGKSTDQIETDQFQKLENLVNDKFVKIYDNKHALSPLVIAVNTAYSEKQLAESLGVKYHRLYVTDHVRPSNDMVDNFIHFVKHLPADTWLHFHCSAGKGRSTTFMAMYDILKNADSVSFQEILKRQFLIDGSDLQNIPEPSDWKHIYLQERLAFLRVFYSYCKDNRQLEQSWSSWLQRCTPLPSGDYEDDLAID